MKEIKRKTKKMFFSFLVSKEYGFAHHDKINLEISCNKIDAAGSMKVTEPNPVMKPQRQQKREIFHVTKHHGIVLCRSSPLPIILCSISKVLLAIILHLRLTNRIF